jgi:hypothetical protein
MVANRHFAPKAVASSGSKAHTHAVHKFYYDRKSKSISYQSSRGGGVGRLTGAHKTLANWYGRYTIVSNHQKYAGRMASVEGAQRRGEDCDRQLRQWTRGDWKRGKTKKPKRLHGFVSNMMALCKMKGWVPVRSQEVVGDPGAGVGTPFDMIVRDRQGKRTLIEFKTGGDNYFENPSGTITFGPHAKVVNAVTVSRSPQTFAQLQAALGGILSRRCGIRVDNTCVVRTGYLGAHHYPTPKWLKYAVLDIEHRLECMRQQQQQQRRRVIQQQQISK